MSAVNHVEPDRSSGTEFDVNEPRWDQNDVSGDTVPADVALSGAPAAAVEVALIDDAPREDWRRRLLSNGVWVTIGRVSGIATTLLSNIILARILAPADFGKLLLIISVAGIGSVIAMFGLNAAMLKLVGESLGIGDRQRTVQVFKFGALVASISIFLFGLVAPWLVWLAMPHLEMTPLVLLSISIAICLISIQQICAESLRGMHEQRWANLLTGGQICGPITALLLIGFVIAGTSTKHLQFEQVLWLMNLSLVITMVVAIYFVWRVARNRLSAVTPYDGTLNHGALGLRTVLALTATLMLINVLIFATGQADVWIAGICFDADSVALYGVARRVATAVGMLAQICELSVVASVVTLHAQGRLVELEKLLRTAATVAALPAIVALLIIMVAGGPLLELCFGAFYRGAASLLVILALGQVLLTWCGACGYVLAFAGHQKVCLLTNLVGTIALFAIGIPAGKQFGMLAVAWTATVVLAGQWIAMTWLTYRLVGVRTDAFIPRSIPVLWGRGSGI